MTFQVPPTSVNGTVYSVTATVVASDAFGIKFPVDPASASITVSGPSSMPGTSLPIGDVDGDGRVGLADAILVLRAVLGLVVLDDVQRARGDLNHNGKIDVGDAIAVLSLSVGLGS